MIVFDLACRPAGHRFEGWFASSQDYARQQQRGLVTCPVCGSDAVDKAVMAPNLARKGNQLTVAAPAPAQPPAAATTPATVPGAPHQAGLPPPVAAMLRAAAAMQAEALKSSRWVGPRFADDARAMHYGERDAEVIHGKATPDEARDLWEEGIAVAPILFPLAAPDETN